MVYFGYDVYEEYFEYDVCDVYDVSLVAHSFIKANTGIFATIFSFPLFI